MSGQDRVLISESEAIEQTLSTFKVLQRSIQYLKEIILADEYHFGWADEELPAGLCFKQGSTLRAQVAQFLGQLEYLDTQDPREILIWAGCFAASQKTLEAITQVNTAKLAFKEAIVSMKKNKVPVKHSTAAWEALLTQRATETNQRLKRIGLGRLHLKQCYRIIPILPCPPLRISWTWAHTRAITKISWHTAERLLKEKGEEQPGIQYQLQKLATLSPYQDLAIVQNLAPHLRTNVVLTEPIYHGKDRMMLKGAVPLFYEATLQEPPLLVPPQSQKKALQRAEKRSDVQIEAEPFLSAIRAHRYVELPYAHIF